MKRLKSTDKRPLSIIESIVVQLKSITDLSDEEAHDKELMIAMSAMANIMEVHGIKNSNYSEMQVARRIKNFLDALETGRSHSLLEKWSRPQSRPVGSQYKLEFRCVAAEASYALQGAGMGAEKARERVAELVATRSRYGRVTPGAVRQWEREAKHERGETLQEAKNFGRRNSLNRVDEYVGTLIEQADRPISKWTVPDPWIELGREALAPRPIEQLAPYALANPPNSLKMRP